MRAAAALPRVPGSSTFAGQPGLAGACGCQRVTALYAGGRRSRSNRGQRGAFRWTVSSQHVNTPKETEMNPTVMVIDNDAEDRDSVAAMLAIHGMEAEYTGRHGIDALQAAARLRPDILLVAVEEPLARSMQTLDFIRELNPACAVVAYSDAPSPELTRRVMRSAAVDL